MNDYLQIQLKVPSHQVINCDKEATRSNIIAAFEGLRDNPRIKDQDPILIYFAGHGGEVPSNSEDGIQAIQETFSHSTGRPDQSSRPYQPAQGQPSAKRPRPGTTLDDTNADGPASEKGPPGDSKDPNKAKP
jgi:DNA-directed RNA polymerase subunit H (RpoH/RPB5)